MFPFKAFDDHNPPPLLHFTDDCIVNESVPQTLQCKNHILDELKSNLQYAQTQMNIGMDAKHKDLHFQMGDMVYLRLQPYYFKSLTMRPN